MATCQATPRATATQEIDMASRPRTRSPHGTAAWVRHARSGTRAARVLPPHSAAVRAGEAPHAHHQLGGPPPRRHMGQAPGHCPTSLSLGPAGLAKGALKPDRHASLHNGSRQGQELAHRGQSQGVQTQESRQIRTGEGSLRHVEVSRDGCLAAPIIEGPRPLPNVTTHPPPPRTHQ